MVEQNGTVWFRNHVVALLGLVVIMLGSLASWWATYATLTNQVRDNSIRIEEIEKGLRTHFSDSARHLDPIRDARINDEILRRLMRLEDEIKTGNARIQSLR